MSEAKAALTDTEERLLAGEQITFLEALYDCCLYGELTREMAAEWLEGEDLIVALAIIDSGHFLDRSPQYLAWREGAAAE